MGTFNVTRIRNEGHTVRWEGHDPELPERTSIIALEGDDVVVYERFSSSSPPTTFQCHVMDFLDGRFNRALKADFGSDVVKEVLASIRVLHKDTRRPSDARLRKQTDPLLPTSFQPLLSPPESLLSTPETLLSTPESLLGTPETLLGTPESLLSTPEPLLKGSTPSLLPDKTPSLLPDETPKLLPDTTPSVLNNTPPSLLNDNGPIIAGARPEDAWADAMEPVRAARLARAKERGEALEALAAAATHFDVQIIECGVVDLSLVVALKRITGASARLLAKTLASLPYTVSRNVEVDDAKALQARLRKLGATTKLQPAA